jgi:hypothetical protein
LKDIVDRESVDINDLNHLFVVLAAQYKMCQTEQALCMVEGTGVSRDCVNMFRFMARNPAFSETETKAFEHATRVSIAASMEQNAGRGGYNRGRGSGRFNRFNRGRGYNNQSHGENKSTSDRYSNLVDHQATKL